LLTALSSRGAGVLDVSLLNLIFIKNIIIGLYLKKEVISILITT